MEHQAVYERLVQTARAREFVHYGELATMLGIDITTRTSVDVPSAAWVSP